MAPTLTKEKTTTHHHQATCSESLMVRNFVYPKDGHYFACCLELNLVSQGETPEEALHNLEEASLFYVRTEVADGKKLKDLVRKAPFYFHAKFIQVVLYVSFGLVVRRVLNSRKRVVAGRLDCDEFIPFQFVV